MVKSKSQELCFVIAPISKPNSDTRKRSNKVLKEIIDPAAKRCGLRAKRADMMLKSGNPVYSQIVGFIAQARIIIADLTEINPNVLLELGHAHAIHKDVILLMEAGQPMDKIPSDLLGQFITFYDLKSSKRINESKKELIRQIQLKIK